MISQATVRRVPDAGLPFPERDCLAVFARGWWPLDWLAFPAATPAVAAYRLRINLAADATVRVRISAGERYRFFLDGDEIGTGPERGDVLHWRIDTYDLTLTAGSHWLAVEVWALGSRAPKWQVPVPPGLLVIGDEPFFKAVSTAHAPWEVAHLDGIQFCDQSQAFLTGPRAVVDAVKWPADWLTGGGMGFLSAAPSRRGVCGGRAGSDFVMPRLVPARLPAPTHELLSNGTAVFVDAPPPPENPLADLPAAIPSAHRADESREWQSWLEHRTPLVIPPGETRRAIIDLGTYRAVWPVLEASGRDGLVRLRFAEALYRNPLNGDRANDRTKGHRADWSGGFLRGLGPDFHTPRDRHVFRAYEWECGRWLEISATAGAEDPLVLHRLALHDTSFPFSDEGALACDRPELETLRAMCVHTLRVGTHGHYCDCPAYERLQYIGDTRLEALVTYCLTRDDRLPARALEDFAGARFADGFLPSRHPANGSQNIPPFSLWWIGMLHDATFWRDRLGRLSRLLPVARGILDAWWGHRTDDGLVQGLPGWNFVDWAAGWEAGMPPAADGGTSAVLNWHFVLALRTVAELEGLGGEPEMAALHRRRASEISTALDAACWDEDRGLYLDAPGRRDISEHAQVLALLAGVAEPRRVRVAAALTDHAALTRTTIYFNHYLIEALRLLGRGDLIWQRLGLWFDLPKLGFTTTPEEPEPSRSDCHPWGTHPLYHIVATLAGLRPAARDFSALTLAPLTNIPLRRIALTVPHPRGEVRIDLYRGSAGSPWQGTLVVPEGVSAFAPPGIQNLAPATSPE